MRNVLLLEAKCASCGHVFGIPTLSDFDYGEAILCTPDGKFHAIATAFGDVAERVSDWVKMSGQVEFWEALASVADPISEQPLTMRKRCPNCRSRNLAYSGGKELGLVSIPEATFAAAGVLSQDHLAQQIRISLASTE